MPHSAADARRRGDQIRRRRTAIVAGGAAAAVAAVAVPIIAITAGGGTPDDERLNVADPPRSVALSTDDLLADGETTYQPNVWREWREDETVEGDGQAVAFDCQQEKLGGLGATATFHRSFDFAVGGEVNDAPYAPTLVEAIAEFPDAATARAAYDEVAQWVQSCGSLGEAEEVSTFGPRTVEVPGGEGVIYDVSGGPAPVEVDPTGDQGYLNETGLVLLDDRIAVLSLTIIGQDYNFLPEEGGTPVNRMLPLAAERLQPGANVPEVPESVSDPGAVSGDTVIDDGFPLAAGWPDSTAEPDQDGLTGPGRDLEPMVFSACDLTAEDQPGSDRLSASWSDVEDYRTRQLTTYSSVAEAEAVITGIADLYRRCPEGEVRDDGYTPNWSVTDAGVGDESYAVLGWDELDGSPSTFGNTTLLVRVGNAVLVADWAGHSGNPQGREDTIVADIVAETTTVIDAMCAFDPDGC